MSNTYIALQAIQVTDSAGKRITIEPRSDKASGLFEHTFDKATAERLLSRGAMRLPEGTERHEDATSMSEMADRRDSDDAPAPAKAPPKGKGAAKADADDLLNG